MPMQPGQAPMRPDEEKMWAIAAHLGPLLLGFVAPLVVWLVFRERSEYLNRQGKEALNFQISVAIYSIASIVLWLIIIGIFLSIAVWITALVLMIIATVKVSNFEDYRYPLTIRLVK
jgi:uncharacterized Tic20 family protein